MQTIAELPAHVAEAIHEAADAAVNPNGYADDGDESDRRSDLRDTLEVRLRRTVVDVIEGAVRG